MLLRFYSPHFASAVWGVYALSASYAYFSDSIATLIIYQETFPINLALLWLAVAVFCLFGGISWHVVERWANGCRIIGITIAAFILSLRAASFWFGNIPVEWFVSANYLMLGLCALFTATFIGRYTPPMSFNETLEVLESTGGGVIGDRSRG